MGRPESGKAALWAALAAAAAALLLFLPSLDNGFIGWDDAENFIENRHYRGLGWANLKWMFTSFSMGPYAPLTAFSFGLDYVIFGMNPFGYHLTAVLLHAANSLLVCLLFTRLLSAAAGRQAEGTDPPHWQPALAAALFFALHPLRAESVCWLSDRHDLLSGFFYLLTLHLYLNSLKAPPGTGYARRHLPQLFTYLLALLAKGMTVTLPPALLLLDIYPLRRLPADPRRWALPEYRGVLLEKLPYFLLALLFGIIGLVCQDKAGALGSLAQQGLGARAGHMAAALFFYVQKTFAPFNLSPIYRLPEGFSILSQQALGAAAALALLTLGAWRLRPAGAAAWGYYLITILPVSGLFKFSAPLADRYSYLPGLGFAALAGAGVWRLQRLQSPALRRAGAAVLLLLLTGLAALTWRQQRAWDSSENLWRHALAVSPGLDTAHNNLGLALAGQGRTAEALEHYQAALRANPRMAVALANIGVTLAGTGDYSGAVNYYLEAVRLDPAGYKAHNNLCGALPLLGRAEQGAAHCREALRIKPDAAGLNNNLGIALAALGRPAEALERYREELRLNPGYAEAYYNMAHELAVMGRLPEALENYAQATRLNPKLAKAHYNLGVHAFDQGRMEDAAAHYRDAIAAAPDMALAHNNLAITLNRLGRIEEAVTHYNEAVRIAPGYAEAWYNMALDLARRGRNAEAARCLARAREINPRIGMR